MTNLARRTVLRAAAAVPLAGALGFPAIVRAASGPEFVFKYGNNLPLTHPLNVRSQEAANQIREVSRGRMEIRIFPNNHAWTPPVCQALIGDGLKA